MVRLLQFNFRYILSDGDWIKVVVNNENGQTYWIRKNTKTKLFTWEEYLKDMFSVARLDNKGQKIRVSPTDDAVELSYEGTDCFQVQSLKEDWMEIFTPDFCNQCGLVKMKALHS